MNDKRMPPAKVHGPAHFFAAAKYSVGGAKRLWGETAFRHEVLAACAILVLFWWINAQLEHVIIAILLILLTCAIEALNTAIEEIVDHVSPEWSLPAKHAKDLGSFAVLCALIGNGVFAAYVVYATILGS